MSHLHLSLSEICRRIMKYAGKDGVEWKDKRTGNITRINKERSLRQRITEALKLERPIKTTFVLSTGLASNVSNLSFKSPSFIILLPRASIVLSTASKPGKNAKRGPGRPPGRTTRPPEYQSDLRYLVKWQKEKASARRTSVTARSSQEQQCTPPPAPEYDPAIWKPKPLPAKLAKSLKRKTTLRVGGTVLRD